MSSRPVVSVDLLLGEVTFTTGEVVPITNMFDCDREDTDNIMDAAVVVVGPTQDGVWLTVSIDPKDRPTVQ